MIVYQREIHPSSSPTSVGRYALVLDEPSATYTVIVQVLLDTPLERDWRSEYNTVAGRYERDGARFTFWVERGRSHARSSAWSGRGEEDYTPFERFTGQLEGDRMTLDYNGTLELDRREGPTTVTPTLILPDYALFD